MKGFILMLQFFTRLPINVELDVKEEDFAKAIIYFPLVGLVIGVINAGAYYLFSQIFSTLISVVMVTLVNVLLTGALHIDGLADTCDGIFSARKKERMLEIMKDSRLGTNGAVAIFFDFSFRIALLSSLSDKNIIIALVISNAISRTMLVFSCYAFKYARPEGGMGNLFIGKVSKDKVLIGYILGTLISIVLLSYIGPILMLSCTAFIWLFNKYITSKIDGITGDILGASNELGEIFILIAFVVMGRYGII